MGAVWLPFATWLPQSSVLSIFWACKTKEFNEIAYSPEILFSNMNQLDKVIHLCSFTKCSFKKIWKYLRSDFIRRLTQRLMFSSSLNSASILKRIASWDAGPCKALENPIFSILRKSNFSSIILAVFHEFQL